MQKLNLLVVAGVVGMLSACSTTPNLDSKFGEALNQSKEAMKIAPNNANTLPNHIELIHPLERYQKQDSSTLATPVTSR